MSDKDRLGPPPVEPMTNAAWSRVERGVFERLDQPSPRALPDARARWPYIVIPVFAVAAAAVILIVAMRDSSPRTEVAEVPTAPNAPSRVVTGETPSQVSYGDAHLTVEAHAAIVMGREDRSPSVLVERGAVAFAVAPRERDPFVVRAGDVVVRVVGTRFRVARYEERISVAVEHGLVDVQFRGTIHRLSTGQSWSTHEQTASAPTTPDPTTTPEPTPSTPDTTRDTPAGPTAKPVSGKPVPTTPDPTTPDRTTPDRTKSDEGSNATADLARTKFNEMAALERTDPERAISGYLDLSKGSSVWAGPALYSAGRLAFDRNDKRARTFLTFYLQRFPRGDNALDARGLLTRLDGAKP
ncbi:MAG: FecR domain-containing protein [Kofleriaceae bacterium]